MKVERNITANIAARLGITSATTAAAAEKLAEQRVAEHIAECAENFANISKLRTTSTAGVQTGVPVPIINRPFLLVAEHFKRFGAEFKAFHGFLIAGISVRVVLHRQFSIGGRDFLSGRIFTNSEHFVIIFLGHVASRNRNTERENQKTEHYSSPGCQIGNRSGHLDREPVLPESGENFKKLKFHVCQNDFFRYNPTLSRMFVEHP